MSFSTELEQNLNIGPGMKADRVYLGSLAADGSERRCRITEADRGRQIVIIHFGKGIL